MVSIKDIAKASGVSVSTVSRVINNDGYVGKDTREKVLKVIKEYDYNPSSIARSLVKKQSNMLGVMIPHINSPFFLALMTSFEAEAKKRGYNLFLCYTNENTEDEENYLEVLSERRVDGIIVTPVGIKSSHFKKVSARIPIVFAGRSFDNLDISSVEVDNVSGSYRVVEHLIKKGHKRIGIVNGSLLISTGSKRWEGAVKAFQEYNIEYDKEIVVDSDFTLMGGYKAALEILKHKNPPTAIYAANHLMSYGVIKALKENSIRVPEDIAIAAFDGFDDSIFEQFLDSPKITANIHPSLYMGEECVRLLCEEISYRSSNNQGHYLSRKIVLNMEFAERESTNIQR